MFPRVSLCQLIMSILRKMIIIIQVNKNERNEFGEMETVFAKSTFVLAKVWNCTCKTEKGYHLPGPGRPAESDRPQGRVPPPGTGKACRV